MTVYICGYLMCVAYLLHGSDKDDSYDKLNLWKKIRLDLLLIALCLAWPIVFGMLLGRINAILREEQ